MSRTIFGNTIVYWEGPTWYVWIRTRHGETVWIACKQASYATWANLPTDLL